MTLTEWLLVAVLGLSALNLVALLAVVTFLWNIDSNAAEATKSMNSLSHHATINEAVERIERAVRR